MIRNKKDRNKIFCISFQRTGTTSVGQFFKDHGYGVATWDISDKNEWPLKWLKGDFEGIFKSKDFKFYNVFEDGPWWYSDFYKVLFHRFPNSRFILLERDSDLWFNSMVSHSMGKTLGNTHRHANLYDRLDEFNDLKLEKDNRFTNITDNLLPLGEEEREHYKKIYLQQNNEVRSFFEAINPKRLFYASLEDEKLWLKLGIFLEIDVSSDYSVHINKSNPS